MMVEYFIKSVILVITFVLHFTLIQNALEF